MLALTPESLPSIDSPQHDVATELDEEATCSSVLLPRRIYAEPPAKCQVCGGPATGYHYEAPSCNSCKAFYRRLMLRGDLPDCRKSRVACAPPSKASPQMTFCRRCRFERCIAAGMDGRMISTTTGATADPILLQYVLRKQGKTADADKLEAHLIALPHKISPAESEHFHLISYLTAIEHDLRQRFNSVDAMLPDSSQDLASFLGHRGVVKKVPMRSLDERGPLPSLSGSHFVVEYECCRQLASNLPFFHKMSSLEREKWFRFAAVASMNLSFAWKARVLKSPAILLRDNSFPFPLPHNAQHHLVFVKPVDVLRGLDIDENEYMLLKAFIMCSCPVELQSAAQREFTDFKLQLGKALWAYELARHGASKAPIRFDQIANCAGVWINMTAKFKENYVLSRYRLQFASELERSIPVYNEAIFIDVISK